MEGLVWYRAIMIIPQVDRTNRLWYFAFLLPRTPELRPHALPSLKLQHEN